MSPANEHIHFIAIGGSAMHNLAIALKNQGYEVTGSDDDIFEPSRTRLALNGILPEMMGWFPEKIHSRTKAVILGMHARDDNPEIRKAREMEIPIYSFPDYIYEATRNAVRIVIAGSHGKTTITSMIIHVLHFLGRDFDFLAGAGLSGFDNMVKLSGAPIAVIEGDEYFSSALDKTPKFIRYKHNIGLISGIAWDHINAFPTREEYIGQFRKFIANTPEDGVCVFYNGDRVLSELIRKESYPFRTVPYDTAEYEIRGELYHLKSEKGNIPLSIFGRHNMQNLAGAIKILNLIGVRDVEIFNAIPSFTGAANRLEKILELEDLKVYRDFAHSPSKLFATTRAVRELYPQSRIINCFELHTFSSLNKNFLSEYQNSMDQRDINIVFVNDHTLKIKRMPYLEDSDIRKGFDNNEVLIFRTRPDLEEFLLSNMEPNTVLLFMSSGNFGGMDYHAMIDKLKKIA